MSNTPSQKNMEFMEKLRPFLAKAGKFFRKLWKNMKILGGYLYKLRAIIMAAPVAAAAVVMAIINMARLPEVVEMAKLSIDAESEDALFGFFVFGTSYVSRGVAILGPLVLTAACLVLMMCSKRTFYPWLVSLMSLVLPLVILLTNIYPA